MIANVIAKMQTLLSIFTDIYLYYVLSEIIVFAMLF